MSEIIHGQVTFLLVTLCCGMALIFFYEILRLLRWMFKHTGAVIWMEDILYWASVSIPVFYIFFVYNDGEIRWYGVLMLVLGAWLYENGISRPVRGRLVKIFGSHKPLLLKLIKNKIKKHIKRKDKDSSKEKKRTKCQ